MFRGLCLSLLTLTSVAAIEIELRYDYDTNGFFEQEGSKQALRAVADFFEEALHDSLDPIVPSGANTWSAVFLHPGTGSQVAVPGLEVPADTLIVFVGGRNHGGGTTGRAGPGGFSAGGYSSWFSTIRYRGEAGAADSPPTDFAPWGGSISFDHDPGREWNFRTDGRPNSNATDFVRVALHEFCHVLGFGSADSFDALIHNGAFIGPTASAVWGGPVPMSGDSHWRDDGACVWPTGYDPDNPDNVLSTTFGSFGRGHGQDQLAIMEPSSCTVSSIDYLKVMTDLDLAALRDIGWEIMPPPRLTPLALGPGSSSFEIPSISGLRYQLRRSDVCDGGGETIIELDGDGSMLQLSDDTAPADCAFYTLKVEDPAALPAAPASIEVRADESLSTLATEPRTVEGCGECAH